MSSSTTQTYEVTLRLEDPCITCSDSGVTPVCGDNSGKRTSSYCTPTLRKGS
jgi:hypothetical protein